MSNLTSKKYLIVGDGKVAKHFAHYFKLQNISFTTWSRSKNTFAALQHSVDIDEPILLLIKDDVIVDFIRTNACLHNKTLIHFSGSLNTTLAHGVHPLMTFGNTLYDIATYKNIYFILSNTTPSFSLLFPQLSNKHCIIAQEQQSLYHSLCVLGGNFSRLLMHKFLQDLELKCGIPKEAAHPYLEQIIKNLLMDKNVGLIGPLARKDETTIKNDLKALHGDPYQKIYQTFVDMYIK